MARKMKSGATPASLLRCAPRRIAPRRHAPHRYATPRLAPPRSATHRRAAPRAATHRSAPSRNATQESIMAAAFQRSELTSALVRYLGQFDKGTSISYEELSTTAGALVDSRSHSLIYARKILERDHNAVWNCVQPKVGIYRLSDPEIAARQSSWYLLGARNKLRNGAKQADVVEIELLDIAQQAKFATDSIIRELARDALSKTTQRRIEKVARGTSNDLPAFNAIEWMITLSPRRSKNA
jgi:hypothetical protein